MVGDLCADGSALSEVRTLLRRTVVMDDGLVVTDDRKSEILGDVALLHRHRLE